MDFGAYNPDMDMTNDESLLKNNNPRVIQQVWADEYNDQSKWTRARVEDAIDQAMRWAVRQIEQNPNVFRDTWPVDAVMSHDEFIALVGSIQLPGKLGATSTVETLFDIMVRWFAFVPKHDRHVILILHGLLMPMEKISELIGESRLITSRRHTRALEKITWHLNHSPA